MNFRYRLMQFMSGRYGADETLFVLVGIAAALAIVNTFVRSMILQLIVYMIMFLAIFRAFSRNIYARRKENEFTKRMVDRVKSYNQKRRERQLDYTHIYKKCPHCKATLRLPKRKGKHTTVCPRCSHSFKVRVRKGI